MSIFCLMAAVPLMASRRRFCSSARFSAACASITPPLLVNSAVS
jgi:hypothetical protein